MFQKFQNLRQGNRSVDEYATEFFKMITSVEIRDTEQQLVMRFVGGLRQQIQFTLNLFRPESISEAHQQALTIEAQNRNNSQPWGTARQPRQDQAQTPVVSSTTLTSQPETAIVPTDPAKQQRPGGLRCFSCGELGHRQSACPSRNRRGLLLDPTGHDVEVSDESPQRKNLFSSRCMINGKVCTFIIYSGSSENAIAKSAVSKLNLEVEPHPSPYKLGWLHQGNELIVTRRTLVHFSVGAYKDQLYCDLVPMDACHLLLGRPWEFDRRFTSDTTKSGFVT
uniref:CCHC-type domain-containing protein n=1 Tax=Brassica oleracea var. oleracea TaxID=109376 RepID=A0A0D3DPS4_BRAOL